MLKHESPSISECTKPIDLKIENSVKNVKLCSRMQYITKNCSLSQIITATSHIKKAENDIILKAPRQLLLK